MSVLVHNLSSLNLLKVFALYFLSAPLNPNPQCVIAMRVNCQEKGVTCNKCQWAEIILLVFPLEDLANNQG